jgi:hypothetical protein
MPDISPKDNATTSTTKPSSSNMNRNTINAIAIRSHQVEDEETVGVYTALGAAAAPAFGG